MIANVDQSANAVETPLNRRGQVSLREVRKSYGSLEVVKGIDLEIAPGEFISLLGPSGCGKTTVLRMLGGFESLNDGVIAISGHDVTRIPAHRRDINTVFQSYALFPHMNVEENVAYGPRRQGLSREEVRARVKEALEAVRMTSFATRQPSMLSGGQQQRIALARAIVNRPSVLLLDAPLAALDRKLREEMQVELKLLQLKLGMTFVFVTHDQEEALSMSDRIAVMNAGRIVQVAEPMQVYDQPADVFVAGFIGLQNFFSGTRIAKGGDTKDGALKAISSGVTPHPGEPAVAAVRPEHVTVQPDDLGKADNSVVATVIGLSSLGDHVRVVCDTPEGTRIIAKITPDRSRDLHIGQSVYCLFNADKTKLFAPAKTQ